MTPVPQKPLADLSTDNGELPLRQPVNRRIAYAVAIGSFGAKSLFAFTITYLVGNFLTKEDYGVWAIIFSISMILGVSELGVGQLILTTLHERQVTQSEADRLVKNALVLMAVLTSILMTILFVILWLTNPLDRVRWPTVIFAVILLRLMTVPHGAYLSAIERYHERKLVDAVVYAVCACLIAWGVTARWSLTALLIGMNVVLTLGSIAILFRARFLGMPRSHFSSVNWREVWQILRGSFPYFVNNVSTLTTYTGFIALSSLILDPIELARLALLHTLLLMYAIQVFELLFKSVQPRMQDPKVMNRLWQFVGFTFILAVIAAGAVGGWLIRLLFPAYDFTPSELTVYVVFVFLEVYFLLIISAMQMQSRKKMRLQWLSIGKSALFIAAVGLVALLPGPLGIMQYLLMLTLISAITALVSHRAASCA